MVLAVMDGWGITQPYSGNAISQANTPVIDELIVKYPSMTLRASGEAVGLPWGEVGNSEVGHLNLGLGRIIYQDLPRINKAIKDNSFYQNEELLKAIEHVKKNNSKLHFIGLTSNGCVHSSIDHLFALVALAKNSNVSNFFIHAFLDGRDTPFNTGANFIREIENVLSDAPNGKIATLSGRFYAMDRNNNWDRIAKAYVAMVKGEGNRSESASLAIEESYKKKVFDEEFVPTVITKGDKPVGLIEPNDAIIFFNYRADRARQLTKSFVIPGFDKFEGWEYLKNLYFACFTEYEKGLPVGIIFKTEEIKNTLGQILSQAKLKQLRIAETEKYAHVTYFFNGGEEEKSEGEEHVLIPSPQVPSYDLKPEMSALQITEKLVKAIEDDSYDFILVNFANADMVGHSGNLSATIKAVETVDKCMTKLTKAVLDKDGILLITADHGNAESMFNIQTGMIDKEHTANPVPFIVVGKRFEGLSIGFRDVPGPDLSLVQPQGILSDIAPTVLKLLDIPRPPEITGRSLI